MVQRKSQEAMGHASVLVYDNQTLSREIREGRIEEGTTAVVHAVKGDPRRSVSIRYLAAVTFGSVDKEQHRVRCESGQRQRDNFSEMKTNVIVKVSYITEATS